MLWGCLEGRQGGGGGGSPNSCKPLLTPPPQISSASNCTDYQSRRLNIMYSDGAGRLRHAHTVGPEGGSVSPPHPEGGGL